MGCRPKTMKRWHPFSRHIKRWIYLSVKYHSCVNEGEKRKMSWFRNSFERRTQRGSWFDAFYSAADGQTVETISFHYKQPPHQNHLTILQWLQNVNRVTRNMHLKKKQEGEFCCSSDYSCKRCLVMPSLSSRRPSFACSIMRVGILIKWDSAQLYHYNIRHL